jgi:hypothetical protein
MWEIPDFMVQSAWAPYSNIFNMDETGLFYAYVPEPNSFENADQTLGCPQIKDLLTRNNLESRAIKSD